MVRFPVSLSGVPDRRSKLQFDERYTGEKTGRYTSMKAIFELINPDNTLSVNRRLGHALGLQEAVVYSALLAKYAWYEIGRASCRERV